MGAPFLAPARMSLFRQGSQFMMIGALQLAVDCSI
ncbi:GtrA family protein, partial [Xanthomonas oryzae pv. oryzicola]|nr:GtrA family protein [Xanthomonas oryzae pv. oryzicola]